MAESGVEQFVTPLRQAQAVLGQVGEVARTLADDSLFGSLMSQLSALPGAASFNPLQASRQMAVDIAPAQQEAPQENAARRQFVDALQQNARKNATETKPEQAANPVSHSARQADESQADQSQARHSQTKPQSTDVASIVTPEKSGEETSSSSEQRLSVGGVVRDTVRATLGSWAALERIAELVQQLESSGAAGKSPAHQEAPEPQGSPLPLASARAPQPAPGTGPQQEQRVQESPPRAKDAGNNGERVAGNLPTLQDLVDGTWGAVSPRESDVGRGQTQPTLPLRPNDATGRAAEQMAAAGSSVAPRGPSMLNPQVAGGNKPGAGAAASPAGTSAVSVTTGGSDRGGLLPLNVGVFPDDELAERLNRALIEQAWRGGVDLT